MPKTYLAVPYQEHQTAKRFGAKWDARVKQWYAPQGELLLIQRWPLDQSIIFELVGEDRSFAGNQLFVDLIPKSCWFTNVRSCVVPNDWDRVRHFVYRRANYRCECCQATSRLDAHERWHYNTVTKVQRLMRIMALCKPCHQATHMGFARFKGQEVLATQHLIRVTGMNELQAHKHIEAAFKQWEARSLSAWNLDLTIITDSGIKLSRAFERHDRAKYVEQQLQDRKPIWRKPLGLMVISILAIITLAWVLASTVQY